eukprot:1175958-Prorocentrum_minimum.AAC.1
MALLGDWAHKIWVEPWQELAEEVKEVQMQEIFVKPWVDIAAEVGIVEDKHAATRSKGNCVTRTLRSSQDRLGLPLRFRNSYPEVDNCHRLISGWNSKTLKCRTHFLSAPSGHSDKDIAEGVSSSSTVGNALDDIFSSLGSKTKEQEKEDLADREHYTKRKLKQANQASPSRTVRDAEGEDDEGDAPVFTSMEVEEGRDDPSSGKALLFRVIDAMGLRRLHSGRTGQKVVWEDGSESRLPAFPKPVRTSRYIMLIALFFVGTLAVYLGGAQLGWGDDTQLDGTRMRFGQQQNGKDTSSAGNATISTDGAGGAKRRHHDPKHMNKNKKHPDVPAVAPTTVVAPTSRSNGDTQKRRHHEPKPKVDAQKGLRPHPQDDYAEEPDPADHPANRMGKPPDP